jgi:putative Ca2+/H+ antiporter (TMEM165/GDT1 family)
VSGWIEIAAIAFVAQLAVLPGEKVQYIIAGLSTRYSPWVVVGAAGTAFAGWTALEIWFGRALQSALSPTLLDILTGAMFAAFAVLLYRSIPETDGPGAVARQTDDSEAVVQQTDGGVAGIAPDVDAPTVLGRNLSETLGGFLPVFAMMTVASSATRSSS